MQVQLLDGVAAANGAPSGATAGMPLRRGASDMQFNSANRVLNLDGFYDNVDEVELLLKMTGTGALTIAYLRAWGYFRVWDAGVDASFWAPLGTGADATKGYLNGGAALGEVIADVVLHAERLRGLRECERFYLEVGTIGGTSPVLDAWLVSRGQVQ